MLGMVLTLYQSASMVTPRPILLVTLLSALRRGGAEREPASAPLNDTDGANAPACASPHRIRQAARTLPMPCWSGLASKPNVSLNVYWLYPNRGETWY